MNEYGGEECQPINAYTLQWQNMNLLEEESSILRFNRFWLVFYFHVDDWLQTKIAMMISWQTLQIQNTDIQNGSNI